MHVSLLEWIITFGILIGAFACDLEMIARHPHEPTLRECLLRLAWYISLALLLGLWTALHHGPTFGLELITGWLTEYSLSLDNLFVFILILSNFKVPPRYRQETLFVGIILALILRGIFTALGAIAIRTLSWIFYLFGIFMAFTAIKMLRGDDDTEYKDNVIVRFARKYLKSTTQWSGLRFIVHTSRGWMITPLFLVVIALATTDLVFAMDSIPAVYGLVRQPYLVFSATTCAVMGLQQLYFILGALLDRFSYLSYGLSFVMIFIGIRMILQALRTNQLLLINNGHPVDVPDISTITSLLVIVSILCASIIFSIYKTRTIN